MPHRGDVVLFKKIDNHIPLCTTHHNFVTAKFDRYHAEGKSIVPKLKWLKEQRLKNNLAFKVFVLEAYD